MTSGQLHRDNTERESVGPQYYTTPALRGLIQQLTHLAFFGDGVSVVQGTHGSGKTSLAKELASHLSEADDVADVNFDVDISLDECVKTVAQALGLLKTEMFSAGEILAELRHYTQSLSNDKKLCMLLIDNAHQMDDQSIGALISLLQGKSESNFGLHSIFIGLPGLDRRIDDLQILDVAVYDFSIPSFSPSELSDFLSAEDAIGGTLDPRELQKIWSLSKGVPGKAIALWADGKKQDAKSDADTAKAIPFGHIAAIAVLVFILVWSLWSRTIGERESETLTSSLTLNTEMKDTKPKTSVKAEKLTLDTSNSVSVEIPSEKRGIDEQKKKEELKVAFADSGSEKIVSKQRPTPNSTPNSKPSPLISRMPALDSPEITPNKSKEDFTVAREQVQITLPAMQAPELGPRSEIGSASKVELSEDEAFLMSQPSNYYVLQVVAASNKNSLSTYMDRQSNRKNLRLYRGTREGKSWYVVVEGLYASRRAALQAIKALPAEQSKAGPWPRAFEAIQQEIQAFSRK
ncbi:MAG: DamX protein [Lentisphaeria bacterium]|jgi:DamX protein